MFGMFKKKAAGAVAEAKRIEKRDLMQACVGIAVLVAHADGDFEPEEQAKLEAILAANESLAGFGAEIGKEVDRFCSLMKAGMMLGKMKVLREIADIKNDQQEAEECFIIGAEMALADGEIEPQEKAILVEVAKTLGLNPATYGI
jgi:tellurite resistance protein TerB